MTTRGGRVVPRDAPVLTLYSRPGCHLCEVARHQLRALQQTHPFHLEEVDIEGDPDLERRFMLEIPVVALGDEVLATAPINLDAVRSAVIAATLGARG